MNEQPTHQDLEIVHMKLDAIHVSVAELVRIVKGGSEPEHSLPSRVSNLEREHEDQKKTREKATSIAWTALGTAAGALALWVVNKFTGGSATP